MQTPLKFITHLFPVWALLLSAIAFYFPAPFAAIKPGSQRTPYENRPWFSPFGTAFGGSISFHTKLSVFILSNFASGSSRHSLAGGHHVRHGGYLGVIAVGLNLPLALLTGMLPSAPDHDFI